MIVGPADPDHLQTNRDWGAQLQLSRENTMSSMTFYKWRASYSGVAPSIVARLETLAEENRRFKNRYAEACIQGKIRKGPFRKGRKPVSTPRDN